MYKIEFIKKRIYKGCFSILVRVILVGQLVFVPYWGWAWSLSNSEIDVDRETIIHWALMEAQLEAEMLDAMEEVDRLEGKEERLVREENQSDERREEVMEAVLEKYEGEREEVMRRVLEQFSESEKEEVKVEQSSAKEREVVRVEEKKSFNRIVLKEEERRKEIRLEVESSTSLILVFPEEIRQVIVVDESLIGYEKISPKELKIFSKAGLGTTVVYVWDTVGRWLFNIKVIVPKIVKHIEQLSQEGKKKEEVLKFSYSTDWWSFYEGKDFDSTYRTDIGHTQTISLYGPTGYGDLNAGVTLEKEGESYVGSYRYISLSRISRWGLKDGTLILGNYFGETSDLTFPGTTLDGIYFSEKRGPWEICALYGETEDYWNYVPLVGQEKANIRGFNIRYKGLSFNYAGRSDVESEGEEESRTVSEEATSVGLDMDLWGWHVSGEVGYDSEKWAGIVNLDGKVGDWSSSVVLKDVEEDYRTISGVPIYSGELGVEISMDRFNNQDYYSVYANVFRDREFPNPNDPDRFNVEFTAKWERSLESGKTYGVSFDYDDYNGTGSPFKHYRMEVYHRRNLKLLNFPFNWSILFAHSDNKDEVLGNRYLVDEMINHLDWELIPGVLDIYSSIDVGQVKGDTGERSHPRVIDTGIMLTKAWQNGEKNDEGKTLSFNIGYRYESHGGMPYSFSSNQDMFYLSSRLDWMFASGRSWFIEADARKYYPDSGDRSVRLEFYTGLRWLWDTGINLLPKIRVWGIVFEDKNSNGKKDEDEEGLPNVGVTVDRKEVKSDADGRYDLGWIRGEEAVVRINSADLPAGMFPVKSDVVVKPGGKHEVRIDFPVRYITGIRVFAFVDSNQNNQLDPGEDLVEGIKVCVEDKCRYTDLEGSFSLQDLSPGEHEIVLDLTSLPEDLLPAVPVRLKVTVSRGEEKKIYIPFRTKN